MNALKKLLILTLILMFQNGLALCAEKFVQLKDTKISDYIAGHELTDEVHWSYKFAKDGTVSWIDLGKERTGKWRVSQAKTLCIDSIQRGKPSSECYELWVLGDRFEFRLYGQTIMEGKLFR